MSGFLAALASLARPILARVLMALGFSVVTMTGGDIAINQIKTQVLQWLGQAPAAAIGLAGMFGVWDALGYIFGAITFALAFFTLTKATSILGTGGGGS